MTTTARTWEEVGQSEQPSWYLDPLVAEQKSSEHRDLVQRWTAGSKVKSALKTDLFEESFGTDHFFPEMFPGARLTALDLSPSTAGRAADRFGRLQVAAVDVRRMGFAADSFDAVVSNSTLDHFRSRAEYLAALAELMRVLRPGGRLVLTLDNPHNVLYHLLKLVCRLRLAPYPLGYSASMETATADLAAVGLAVRERQWLIHHPRLVSTLLFGLLRLVLGRHASGVIGWLLRAFARLGGWPTRRFTACFLAICAEKPR